MEKSFKEEELPVPGTVPILDRPKARDTVLLSYDIKITKHTAFDIYVYGVSTGICTVLNDCELF